MPRQIQGHNQLIRQLESVSFLDEEDRIALRGLPMRRRAMDAGRDIFREGLSSTECCVILSGVGCRCKIVVGGRRQILSFHFAGDMPDLQALLFDRMDHSLRVLTNSEVGFIPHEALRIVSQQRPSLGSAFSRQTLVEAAIHREWIANVGRRLAPERVAH